MSGRWLYKVLSFGWKPEDLNAERPSGQARHSPDRGRHSRRASVPMSQPHAATVPRRRYRSTSAQVRPPRASTISNISDVITGAEGLSCDAFIQHPDAVVIEDLDELLKSPDVLSSPSGNEDIDELDVAPVRRGKPSVAPILRCSTPENVLSEDAESKQTTYFTPRGIDMVDKRGSKISERTDDQCSEVSSIHLPKKSTRSMKQKPHATQDRPRQHPRESHREGSRSHASGSGRPRLPSATRSKTQAHSTEKSKAGNQHNHAKGTSLSSSERARIRTHVTQYHKQQRLPTEYSHKRETTGRAKVYVHRSKTRNAETQTPAPIKAEKQKPRSSKKSPMSFFKMNKKSEPPDARQRHFNPAALQPVHGHRDVKSEPPDCRQYHIKPNDTQSAQSPQAAKSEPSSSGQHVKPTDAQSVQGPLDAKTEPSDGGQHVKPTAAQSVQGRRDAKTEPSDGGQHVKPNAAQSDQSSRDAKSEPSGGGQHKPTAAQSVQGPRDAKTEPSGGGQHVKPTSAQSLLGPHDVKASTKERVTAPTGLGHDLDSPTIITNAVVGVGEASGPINIPEILPVNGEMNPDLESSSVFEEPIHSPEHSTKIGVKQKQYQSLIDSSIVELAQQPHASSSPVLSKSSGPRQTMFFASESNAIVSEVTKPSTDGKPTPMAHPAKISTRETRLSPTSTGDSKQTNARVSGRSRKTQAARRGEIDDPVIPLLDIDPAHFRAVDVFGPKVSSAILAQKRICLSEILWFVLRQDYLYRGLMELSCAGPASHLKAHRARRMLRGPRWRSPSGSKRRSQTKTASSAPHVKREKRACEGEVLQPSVQPYSYPVQAFYPLPAAPPVTSHMPPAAEGASDTKMLAKATRALQEHVKDMTEKTKTGCCMGKHSAKENVLQRQNNILNAPVPDIHYITDRTNGITYVKGKLLGKGGFAKCYELTDLKTGKTYAGKIISKNRINKPHQREKIAREVELHRNLKNPHVVSFHSYFEDEDSVYIILENCSRKSLVHVLKNRKTLTEPEVRFFLRHLVEGCKYIHSQRIVHRDLKLGNMLINENMNIKVADFGLATRMEYEGEKKMTVCGTPNYIAPEVLQKKGHSYEADIWAMGCVMYAMLIGRPPFETSTLKETYHRITENKYHIPSHISHSARNLITKLLSAQPHHRPTLDKILQDDFFSGYTPKSLSISCCDHPPKFSLSSVSSNRPKSYAAPVSPGEAMLKITSSLAQLKAQKRAASPSPVRTVSSGRSTDTVHTEPVVPSTTRLARESRRSASTPNVAAPEPHRRPNSPATKAAPPVGSPFRLYQMLTTCLEQMPSDSDPSPVHDVKPLWVTKWVDYSNKYGFGFQLSDKSVGVLFNDTTRMLLSPDGKTIQYNDLSNKVYTFSSDSSPREYRKKCTLLLYFAEYMDEHLIHGGDILKAGAPVEPTAIFMKKWFRTQKAIVMYLNNGTLQVNFFEDHTKVILSADNQDYILTYINSSRQAVNYRLLQLRHFGCHPRVAERLHYARSMLEGIINIQGEPV